MKSRYPIATIVVSILFIIVYFYFDKSNSVPSTNINAVSEQTIAEIEPENIEPLTQSTIESMEELEGAFKDAGLPFEKYVSTELEWIEGNHRIGMNMKTYDAREYSAEKVNNEMLNRIQDVMIALEFTENTVNSADGTVVGARGYEGNLFICQLEMKAENLPPEEGGLFQINTHDLKLTCAMK